MPAPAKKRRYFAPLDIIPHRPDDEPLRCLPINDNWIPYLLFAIDTGRYPESWLGTLDENKQARNDVKRLIEMLMEAGGCEDMITVNCCCETKVVIHQVNPITLQLEISVDNGETWTPDPESPIIDLVAQPPPVPLGTVANKCDAATNGASHMDDIILGVSLHLETAITVFELAVAICESLLIIILSLVLTGGTLTAAAIALAAAIWGAAVAVFNMGKAAFDDYWTQDEKDKILCALYCNIGDDGAFTDAGYAAFLADWKAVGAPSPAFNLVYQEVVAVGKKGLNNMCSYGGAAQADCSDCSCDPCNSENWNVFGGSGIVTERDTGEITVQAVLVGAQYEAFITTANGANCCVVESWTGIGGISYWNNCGEQWTGAFANSGDAAGHCGWRFGWVSFDPFTVVVTLAAGEGCV